MQSTPETIHFLEGIQKNDGPEMRDACEALIQQVSEGIPFNTFAVRNSALEVLNYSERHASDALAAKRFDARED